MKGVIKMKKTIKLKKKTDGGIRKYTTFKQDKEGNYPLYFKLLKKEK